MLFEILFFKFLLYILSMLFDIEVTWRETIVNLRLVHASPAMCMKCILNNLS